MISSASPYPGIRPVSDPKHLKGRKTLVDSLVDYLENSSYPQLIELNGPSGVGKSSFLQAGLAPRLEKLGWRVLPMADWGRLLADGRSEEAYGVVARQAIVSLRDRSANAPQWVKEFDGLNYRSVLDTGLGRTLVIFDQVDELLRADLRFARELLAGTCEVMSKPGAYWHIVSFRDDVRHEIAALVERRLPSTLWTDVPVDPLDKLEIEDLVRDPLGAVDGTRLGEVEPEFITALQSAWARMDQIGDAGPAQSALAGTGDAAEPAGIGASRDAAADAQVDHGSQNSAATSVAEEEPAWGATSAVLPGLLHLQALLAVCWELAREESSDGIPHIHRDLLPEGLLDKPSLLFQWGLNEYVGHTIVAATASAFSESWRQRVLRGTIARAVPHLWASGFKSFQETQHLSVESLHGLRDLGVGPKDVEPILVKAAELASQVTGQKVWQELESSGSLPTSGDAEAVAGIAKAEHWSPVRVVCELAAMFERALELLDAERIVRVTRGHDDHGRRRRVVGLTHDALGEPLAAWATRELKSPWVNIDSLVAVSGKQVLGDVLARELKVEAEWRPDVTGRLEDLVWLGCQITANFEHMVFSNCSFAGSMFNRSRFKNVKFENCDFKGAIFMNCEFVGDIDTVIDGSKTLNALTFKWQPDFDGDGLNFSAGASLRLHRVDGSGLFVEGASGGELRIQESTLKHVMILAEDSQGKRTLDIAVEGSTIRHLSVDGSVRTPVRLSGGSQILFADVATADLPERSLDSVFGRGHPGVSEGPG